MIIRYKVSEEFINECKADIATDRTGRIHVVEDDIDLTGEGYDGKLVDFTIEDNCYVKDTFIGTTVAKKITVNLINPDNELNLENKEIEAFAGIEINGEVEEVPFGNFIVEKPTNEEIKEKTKFVGYDYMIKFNKLYDDSQNIYPKKLKDLFADLCLQVGLQAGDTNIINGDYEVLGNPFTGGEDCRTVLSAIAQLAGGFATIGRDNMVYIKTPNNTASLLTVKEVHEMPVADLYNTPVKRLSSLEENAKETVEGHTYFDDFTRNDFWGAVNQLILSISGTEGENTIIQDDENVAENGAIELTIADNPFLVSQREREKVITPLWNALKGLKYIPFKTNYYGFPYLDAGDLIVIYDPKDVKQWSYVFNHTFKYNGAFSGTLETQAMTKTQTAYKNIMTTKTRFKQAERKIDKINGEIEDIVEEQTDFSNQLTQHKQNIDGITDNIERIYDFTKTVSGTNELLLEDCLPTNMLKFRAYANTSEGKTITVVVGRTSRVVTPDPRLPSKKLFPSKTLLPRSNGYYRREYTFNLEEPLRHFNDVHDELLIEVDQEQGICTAKILRYIKVDEETGATTVLNEPIEEILGETYLELYKGNNFVWIEEFTDWQMQSTYIFNNELNKWYSPRVESNTKIRQTADEIELKVSEKANKDEIVSLINLSPEEIKIQSSKLALEGLTTINGGFSIDEQGNASIANETVLINDKGIQMKDGATLVGGKGLLTNVQISPVSVSSTSFYPDPFCLMGYEGVMDNGSQSVKPIKNQKSVAIFFIDLPPNFNIEYAYISIIHIPMNTHTYPNWDTGDWTVKDVWGYSRSLGLYKGSYPSYMGFDQYDYVMEFDRNSIGAEIVGAFGANGFVPKVTTSQSTAVFSTGKSIDLTSQIKSLTGEVPFLAIQERGNPPSVAESYGANEAKIAPYYGRIRATLNIFGYLSLG